jgi:hypothetical protein
VFILRRSAGFAFSFLSILRAEAMGSAMATTAAGTTVTTGTTTAKGAGSSTNINSNNSNNNNNNSGSLLDYTIASLIARQGIILMEDNKEDNKDDDDAWKLSVHALNVLRLIILDGSFPPALATPVFESHLPNLLMLVIEGFSGRARVKEARERRHRRMMLKSMKMLKRMRTTGQCGTRR